MPTVLITGINGFVAVHTAVQFLENGWNVRGTVRSKSKGEKALALPCFEKYQGKIDFVVVEDLIEGDFSEALNGVEAVSSCDGPTPLHIPHASPTFRFYVKWVMRVKLITDRPLCFAMALQRQDLGRVP